MDIIRGSFVNIIVFEHESTPWATNGTVTLGDFIKYNFGQFGIRRGPVTGGQGSL